jgi:hypothetical protein
LLFSGRFRWAGRLARRFGRSRGDIQAEDRSGAHPKRRNPSDRLRHGRGRLRRRGLKFGGPGRLGTGFTLRRLHGRLFNMRRLVGHERGEHASGDFLNDP